MFSIKIIFKMKVLIFCICLLIKSILTSIRTALILHWIDSTHCWKHPTQISIHVDMLLQIYCSVLMQFLSEVASSVVFCCRPSASRFNMLYIEKCSCAYPGCNKWLQVFSCQSEAVWTFSSDIKKGIFTQWVFSVFQSCIPWRLLFGKIPLPKKINANAV